MNALTKNRIEGLTYAIGAACSFALALIDVVALALGVDRPADNIFFAVLGVVMTAVLVKAWRGAQVDRRNLIAAAREGQS